MTTDTEKQPLNNDAKILVDLMSVCACGEDYPPEACHLPLLTSSGDIRNLMVTNDPDDDNCSN